MEPERGLVGLVGLVGVDRGRIRLTLIRYIGRFASHCGRRNRHSLSEASRWTSLDVQPEARFSPGQLREGKGRK